jgi:PAS domain S-box-containing protein
VRDEAGRITRWFGTCTDIHDRQQADEANARLAAIVSSSPDAIISFAAEGGRILTWNKGAEETFGYTAGEAVGAPVDLLVPTGMLTSEEDATGVFQAAMMQGWARLESRRRCKDGRIIHVSVTATRMKDEAGKVLGVSAIFRDITERKSAEERQHLLTRELHHRIKNTLATVQAIAGSTARSVNSLEEFSTRFADRLISMGRTHTLVTENAWQGASLRDLLLLELDPYDDGSSNRIRLVGPEVYLPADTALALGLGFHELTTNAAKHGSLSVFGGQVEVAWSRRLEESAERLRLAWVERDGPAVANPTRRGFGSQLLQRVLGTQVDGSVKVTYDSAGLQVEIDLPLKV